MTGHTAHVVVIGGGIAGTSAALALHKAGISVTVCEAHPGSAGDLGAFLTLAGNGMRALDAIDAATVISEVGFDLTELSALGADGVPLTTRPMGEPDHPLYRFRCLRWSALTSALQAEAVRRGIPLRHDATFVSAIQDASGVTASFADGSRITADLLLGADGINSRVRRIVDPQAATPRYAGQRVFYGYTSTAQPPTAPGRITMVRGQAASFGYAVSPAGETFWFARQSAAAVTETGPATAALRHELLEALRWDSTPTADIVEATDDLLVTNTSDLPDVTTWSRGRLLLTGDAAHAASPATGQGASMAFEDAVVLAKALRDSDSVNQAITLFERVRMPRTQRNMEASAAMTGRGTPPPAQSPTSPTSQDTELLRQMDWNAPLTPTPTSS
ncbi:FAD-dependent oxidoreductase [Kineosporia sp. NBRC 101731]|uniref:FAD-dependent oxidoreductase n=1 Tax=Kineosporia sp. NBRC 101731 TaxID=3032199 RepID=UPI0024A05EF9|nr:FAD-dependent oxidoreductase [Kineosporia sp. NBRC 101731]GLY30755.1 FAD-dependent oxidoreductase [Kineosporia sp. NBRC 101731]